nr:hypothetical protein [uncultured Carboxylicivirga sp.]
MKIKFKKGRLLPNLFLGLLWIILGVYNLVGREIYQWSDFLYLVAGSLYVVHFLNDIINQYLTIDDNVLRKNRLYGFKSKINLDEVYKITQNAGMYTLKTSKKELKINITFIDRKSLERLNKRLEQLNLSSENTPFVSMVS